MLQFFREAEIIKPLDYVKTEQIPQSDDVAKIASKTRAVVCMYETML